MTELDRRFVDEQAASKILNLKVATLLDWRFRNTGPNFCRFGRAVRYPVSSLDEYARACEVSTARQ